jgi:urease accessory protein
MRSGPTRILAILFTLVPTAAFAHTGAGYAHGFADGLVHPLGGLDHILAMVTVGILAWQLGGRAIWLLPASFLALMVVGGVLALAGGSLPWVQVGVQGGVQVGIAASVIVFGIMVTLGTKAPLALATGIVGLFAVFHGHAHGTEMPISASGAAYGAGFVLATALLHAAGIALGYLIGRISREQLAYRLGGCGIVLAGVGILAHAI